MKIKWEQVKKSKNFQSCTGTIDKFRKITIKVDCALLKSGRWSMQKEMELAQSLVDCGELF